MTSRKMFDVKCDSCGLEFEALLTSSKEVPPTCYKCNSAFTRVVWRTTPGIPAQKVRPYDLLDRPIPEEPIVFGPPKGGWKK